MHPILYRFIHYFQRMELSQISAMLNPEKIYDDKSFEDFIAYLGAVFQHFQDMGDTGFIAQEGKCEGHTCPNFDKKGIVFRGNHSGKYISLVIDTDESDIQEFSFCAFFRVDFSNDLLSNSANIVIDTNEPGMMQKGKDFFILKYQLENVWDSLYASGEPIDYDSLHSWMDTLDPLMLEASEYYLKTKDSSFLEYNWLYYQLVFLSTLADGLVKSGRSDDDLLDQARFFDLLEDMKMVEEVLPEFERIHDYLKAFNWNYLSSGYLEQNFRDKILVIDVSKYPAVFNNIFAMMKLYRKYLSTIPM
ncbi:MAG: hypothetical protein IPM26_14210 [Saprospiraceae bacterium]|nr:hypothetical protein [Saprospiraceae bacterium]